MNEFKGLCHRCEHWAKFLENNGRPRYECGDVVNKCFKCDVSGEVENKNCDFCNGSGYSLHSKSSCYMYQPIRPIVLAKNENDDRPQFAGSMISARSHGVEIADFQLNVKQADNGNTLYWEPKDELEKN